MHTSTSHEFATADGGKLSYQIVGQGPAIILIHAGIADSRMWESQFEALSRHHTVVRYDLRGFGKSDTPQTPFSHPADLYQLLEKLGLKRAILVGASLGGATALDFVLAHPDMVEGLILLAPGLSGYQWSEDTIAWWNRIDEALETQGIEGAIELETRMWVDGPLRRPDEIDPAIRHSAIEMNRDILRREWDETLERKPERNAIDHLAEIRVPALVIVGGGDVPDIAAIADLIEQKVPGAKKIVVPDAAHLVSMERPEDVNQLITEFVEGKP